MGYYSFSDKGSSDASAQLGIETPFSPVYKLSAAVYSGSNAPGLSPEAILSTLGSLPDAYSVSESTRCYFYWHNNERAWVVGRKVLAAPFYMVSKTEKLVPSTHPSSNWSFPAGGSYRALNAAFVVCGTPPIHRHQKSMLQTETPTLKPTPSPSPKPSQAPTPIPTPHIRGAWVVRGSVVFSTIDLQIPGPDHRLGHNAQKLFQASLESSLQLVSTDEVGV